MLPSMAPVGALLLGFAFLMFAGGLNGLILPVRGLHEGFDTVALGLLGSGWAIGYVAGCLTTATLVRRIGHIRAFGVMCVVAALSVLASLLFLTPLAWIPLRAASGFCFAGAAMIVESWIGEQSDASMRGRMFGAYTMVSLVGLTAGQLAISAGDPAAHGLFVMSAVFYCLALIPTAVFSTTSPAPVAVVRLDVPALWRNSPVAVVAVFLVGLSNGAFGTLAVVYAASAGFGLVGIALFASVPILSGAVAQIPFGMASDRTDRRAVLLLACAAAISAELVFVLLHPSGLAANLGLIAVFGGAVFAMYPLIVAHANDHAPPGTYIQTSGGLLLMLGLGNVVGPMIGGILMVRIGGVGLFAVALAAHVGTAAFTAWRMWTSAPAEASDKSTFVPSPPVSATTETAALAPGATDDPAGLHALDVRIGRVQPS